METAKGVDYLILAVEPAEGTVVGGPYQRSGKFTATVQRGAIKLDSTGKPVMDENGNPVIDKGSELENVTDRYIVNVIGGDLTIVDRNLTVEKTAAVKVDGKDVVLNKGDSVKVGDIITYTITVTNSGNIAAEDVLLKDIFKIGTEDGALVWTDNDPTTKAFDVSANGGTESFEATYTVQAADAGKKITNSAVLKDDPESGDPQTEVTVDQPGTHTVTWVDYNGTVLRGPVAVTNGTPNPAATEYSPNPTRDSDGVYDYTFIGWYTILETPGDPNSNVTYQAAYRGVARYVPPVNPPPPGTTPTQPTTPAPGTTIIDPEVPLGTIGLNDKEHFAYLIGYDGNIVRPEANVTRAEVATMVNRMLDRVPDKDHLLDSMIVWNDNPESAWYYEAIQEATNSHDYDRDEIGITEIWTELLANRDWAALETEWATAASAPGGEVTDGLGSQETAES